MFRPSNTTSKGCIFERKSLKWTNSSGVLLVKMSRPIITFSMNADRSSVNSSLVNWILESGEVQFLHLPLEIKKKMI